MIRLKQLSWFLPVGVVAATFQFAFADDVSTNKAGGTNVVEAGHSLHGEVFDEGPRQAAKLLPGTGKVKLKISSRKPEAQAFFNQGLGQLEAACRHGAENLLQDGIDHQRTF